MRYFVLVLFTITFSLSAPAFAQLPSGWKAHDLSRPAPTVVTPADSYGGAPSDAVVLFDGKDMSNWRSANGGDAKWKVVDGAMESVPKSGFVYSREEFGDCQIHLEFATPTAVKKKGQGRGNSGVYLMEDFEIQILDSFENPTYADGSAGSIYGQYPPLVNASRKPGEWQSYDIVFRRPRFDENGTLAKPARLTVLHNGVLVQDGSEAFGPSRWILHRQYSEVKEKTKGALALQDHGNPVRYRNIWVRPLIESRPQPEKAYQPASGAITEETAQNLIGKYAKHRIAMEDGKLFLHFSGNTHLELLRHSATEFGFAKSAGSMICELDETGKCIAIDVRLDATGNRKAARNE